ncbi:uncharacterized protein LOC122626519 isoform X2 [Drosophila teissieri]|nr:uncharacterized protein LOC122626519 isoform X2 [Drosophila teissieri]
MEFKRALCSWNQRNNCEKPSISKDIRNKEDHEKNLVLNKSIRSLLSENEHGKALLNKNTLLEVDRVWLINAIVEEAINNYILIKVCDFPKLVEEICYVFPNEKTNKDFYYINRTKYKNPTGKLYSRYKNKRYQLSKDNCLGRKQNLISGSSIQSHRSIPTEVDEAVAKSLKAILKRDCADWHDVCLKWKQTFHIRQKDLNQLSAADFLKAWPRLCHAQAPELINIDFQEIYAEKENALFLKWDDLKTTLFPFYDKKVKNHHSRQQLTEAKSAINEDAQDFLFAILLNAVLPPTARFVNEQGRKTKKVTIADAQNSMVLRLDSLNDYKRQIDKQVCLHYAEGSSLQPFIIVHGTSDTDLAAFYVYFDQNLFKFDSFLRSLDTCFKIFNCYGLKYPEPCEQAWTFIQKYVYGIETEFDKKSPNLTTVLSYLHNQN